MLPISQVDIIQGNYKLTLSMYQDGKVKWESNKAMQDWPIEFKRGYSNYIKLNAKTCNISKEKKLKKYFFAKGIEYDERLYQEIFRGVFINIGEAERDYIKNTIREATSFFQEDFSFFETNVLANS